MINRLKKILLSIQLFSHLVIGLPLRSYQIKPANAIIDSCLHQRGLEFLLVFPRQSGKDETIGQLVTFLLLLFHRVEAGIVHTYPTDTQTSIGITRLTNRLKNRWTKKHYWSKANPSRLGIGLALCAFFSGHPLSKAEGATANLLLIVNEVQDQIESIIEKRFTMMRASTNATAVYVGTVRTTNDYLWRTKTKLEKLEKQDGIKRVFIVDPDQVGRENPHYDAFVENQVLTKGRHHPIVKTELFNEPVDVAAGLFPRRRLNLMRGTHTRLDQPQRGEIYLALIDIGGEDEAATEGFEELDNPDRDFTTTTIIRVKTGLSSVGPTYQAVDVMMQHGTPHFQRVNGQPSLFDKLLLYLNRWNVTAAIVDETGVGSGIKSALTEAFTRQIFGFTFTRTSKARLGNDFLAVIETGRFTYFKDTKSFEGSDYWWFFTQAENCGYELAEGQPIEKGLRWGVSNTAKVSVHGERLLIHDDRLLSAALIAEADRLYREGDLFLSTGQSAVIPPSDIIADIDQGGWS